jgi:hypothetical protein
MKTITSLGRQFRGAAAAGSLALIGAFGLSTAAEASLVTFKSYSGNVAVSTDGWGGTDGSGAVTANAPSGSKVIAAYLYTATWAGYVSTAPTTVTLNGSAVTYSNTSYNNTVGLGSHRADVTSIVKSVIDGGAGGAYNFSINEGSDNFGIDGNALVVVYENAALPDSSVGILDGFAAIGGDTTSINFADPLDPDADGFFAEMRLGIGFSCCGQASDVTVNGTKITTVAGNNDDGEQQANGSLITMGGDDDPFSTLMPGYTADHERYNLADYITKGDTSIKVDTRNPSNDDNIFLAVFHVSGKAGFNEDPDDPDTPAVPLPAAGWLLAGGLMGLAGLRRRAKR